MTFSLAVTVGEKGQARHEWEALLVLDHLPPGEASPPRWPGFRRVQVSATPQYAGGKYAGHLHRWIDEEG